MKTMEQRASDRRPVAIEVDIFQRGAPVRHGRTRDVGLGGAFVEGPGLPLRAEVELAFRIPGARERRLRARVVRVEDGGSGVAFHDLDLGAVRALQDVIALARYGTA